uniref:Uncharacterized protein n=1 Tax=Aegilops tauschii TaxID=37682 RepID=M8D9C1_AEGTA
MNASTRSITSIATGTSISIDGGGGSGGRTSGRITSDAVTNMSRRNEKYLPKKLSLQLQRLGSSSVLYRAFCSDGRTMGGGDEDDVLPAGPPAALHVVGWRRCVAREATVDQFLDVLRLRRLISCAQEHEELPWNLIPPSALSVTIESS